MKERMSLYECVSRGKREREENRITTMEMNSRGPLQFQKNDVGYSIIYLFKFWP